ncbi:hypothetical protein QJS10_CPB11g01808 [Acorus calamus]|uniref:DUF295 domain-containing protein n=1 Tax=Acorus calamus TaxID=4465 RepID=A0AAV9DV55_ACOCL|nr:hypothetical protein QJS10_CPB11g01808 [Acorus calamus]
MEGSNDWSSFPPDLLFLITNYLTLYEFIIFGSVCVSWRNIYNQKLKKVHNNNGFIRGWRQMPWLVLPLSSSNNTSKQFITHEFYSPSDGKTFHIDLPLVNLDWFTCIGSSSGELIIADPYSRMCILNPLTRARVCISSFGVSMPHRATKCYDRGIIVAFTLNTLFKVSMQPMQGTSKLLRVLDCHIWDIIFYKGRVYALVGNGRLLVVNLCDGNGEAEVELVAEGINDSLLPLARLYLVESSGELLQVVKFRDEEGTITFNLYKFDETNKQWQREFYLGEHALFLNSRLSMSVSASGVCGMRRNCIYFIEPTKSFSSEIKVFNMMDKVTQLYCKFNKFEPIWMMPSLS